MIRILLLSLLFLTACRTIQKASSKSDIASSESESTKFNRETITEYIVRDTSGKQVIVNVMPSQSGQNIAQDPIIIHQKEPYIIRQTIRESGENTTAKTEQIKEETKEKEASMPVEFRIASLILAVAVLLIALVMFIRLFKR